MLTTASTQGQGGGHPSAGGTKVQGFPTGYLPVPTSATPGAGQTLVFGQLGVLGSPQPPPSLQQQQQQQSANKQDQVQKVSPLPSNFIFQPLTILLYLPRIVTLGVSFLISAVHNMYSGHTVRRQRRHAICSVAVYAASCLDGDTAASTPHESDIY